MGIEVFYVVILCVCVCVCECGFIWHSEMKDCESNFSIGVLLEVQHRSLWFWFHRRRSFPNRKMNSKTILFILIMDFFGGVGRAFNSDNQIGSF